MIHGKLPKGNQIWPRPRPRPNLNIFSKNPNVYGLQWGMNIRDETFRRNRKIGS